MTPDAAEGFEYINDMQSHPINCLQKSVLPGSGGEIDRPTDIKTIEMAPEGDSAGELSNSISPTTPKTNLPSMQKKINLNSKHCIGVPLQRPVIELTPAENSADDISRSASIGEYNFAAQTPKPRRAIAAVTIAILMMGWEPNAIAKASNGKCW